MYLSQGPIHLSGLRWYTSSRKPSGLCLSLLRYAPISPYTCPITHLWHPYICPATAQYLPCHRQPFTCPAIALHPLCHSPAPNLPQPCTYPATALYLLSHRPVPALSQPCTCSTTLHITHTSMASVPAHFSVSLKDTWKPRLHLFFSPLDSLKMVGLRIIIKLL